MCGLDEESFTVKYEYIESCTLIVLSLILNILLEKWEIGAAIY